MILVPIRTGRGGNEREHWRARHRRVKTERAAIGWQLYALPDSDRPATPCVVTLTRVAPSNGLDDDNLVGALKAVRDQVAEWLVVDDKLTAIVRYEYRQKRGPWGVEITFETD